jgi:hemolysin activation/secretion protein
MRASGGFSIVVALVVAGLCAPGARAQTPADVGAGARNAERIQREQEERQRHEIQQELERRRPPASIEAPAPPQPGPGDSTRCVDIREIRINAAPNLPESARREIVGKYVGRCLSLVDIQQLLADIVASYIERGFIAARAYIQQQDVSKGTLDILAVEGSLEKISIEDGGKKSISTGNVFPGLEGKPLNLRDLEQGIDQINRLASNNATLEIRPGAEAGGSVVGIKNQPGERVRLNVASDNQGYESTGRNQASAGISIDNPLGFNDFFTVTHRRSVPTDYSRKGSTANNAIYVLPYGYNTFTAGGSTSSYVSTLRTSGGQELKSNGDSSALFVKAERVVYRGQSSRASVSTGLNVKESKNYLADQFLASSSRKLAVWDLDASLSGRVGDGVGSVELGMSEGLKQFGALQDAPNLPDNSPKAQFRKIRYGASYLLPFKLANTDVALSSQLYGQHGIDVLYGSEQILVGGIYSVRGFVNTAFTGDDGFTLRNDLSTRVPLGWSTSQPAVLRPYVALDYGRVYTRGPDTVGGYLIGGAVGCSLNIGSFTAELFNAWPIAMSEGARRESSRLYLQARAAF